MSSRLTKFLQDYVIERVDQELCPLKLGFYAKEEKPFKGLKFDVYAYSKKRGIMLIWEIEIGNCPDGCITNVRKVRRILNFKWLPYVHMFHIFSPFCDDYEGPCKKVAKNLQKKNELRFSYKQFSIPISYDEFDEIYKAFEDSKKRAEQDYGRRLRVHMGKIVRNSIHMFVSEDQRSGN